MALRDKLEARVSPLIEFRHPGERIECVFLARTWAGFPRALLTGWFRNYVIAVTDRSIVVFRAGQLTSTMPKEEVASFPRDALTGGIGGWCGSIEIGGTRYLVNGQWRKDVEGAVRRIANPS